MPRMIHAGITAIRGRLVFVRVVILFVMVALVVGHGAFLYYMQAHLRMSVGRLLA